jgi:FkbM family methyltransferase
MWWFIGIALSDKSGISTLNVNATSGSSSILTTHSRGSSYWEKGMLETKAQVQVSVKTIDTFCRERKISKIDILKLDVQGNELRIIKWRKENVIRPSYLSNLFRDYFGSHI